MKTTVTIAEARRLIVDWKQEGKTLGLVPTMGFLHQGHESLIQRALEENDNVVVSIFVNPTQFGPGEDLDRYPRDFARDEKLCASLGVDLLFHPEPDEMYPSGFETTISVGGLAQGLCGRRRPTHFQGVCTVVCKLFTILNPDRAYFGQKDAQQLEVIRRMTTDLNLPVAVVGCPIVREADGLAKSSRNNYLSPEERNAATALNRALQLAAEAARSGEKSCDALLQIINSVIDAEPLLRLDYAEIVDSSSLQPVSTLNKPTLIALAVFDGKTRLIDNVLVYPFAEASE